MKNAALSGKPYAGNPHVRFDEGEVASVKPRRGSPLYKKLVVAGVLFASAAAGAADYELAAGETDTISTNVNYTTMNIAGDLTVSDGAKVTAATGSAVNLIGGSATVSGKTSQLGTYASSGTVLTITNNADGVVGKIVLDASGSSAYNIQARPLNIRLDDEIAQRTDGYVDIMELRGGWVQFFDAFNYSTLTSRVTVIGGNRWAKASGYCWGAGIFRKGAFLFDLQNGGSVRFYADNQQAGLNEAGVAVRTVGTGTIYLDSRWNDCVMKVCRGAYFNHVGKLRLNDTGRIEFQTGDAIGPNVTGIDVEGGTPWINVQIGTTARIPCDVALSPTSTSLGGQGTLEMDCSEKPLSLTAKSGDYVTLLKTGSQELTVNSSLMANVRVQEGTLRFATRNCTVRDVCVEDGAEIVVDGVTLTLDMHSGMALKCMRNPAFRTVNGGKIVCAGAEGTTEYLYHPQLEGAVGVQSGTLAASAWDGDSRKYWRFVFKGTASSPGPLLLRQLYLFDKDNKIQNWELSQDTESAKDDEVKALDAGKARWRYSSVTNIADAGVWWQDHNRMGYVFGASNAANNYPCITSPVLNVDDPDSYLTVELRLKDAAMPITGYTLGFASKTKYANTWDVYASADGETWELVDAQTEATPYTIPDTYFTWDGWNYETQLMGKTQAQLEEWLKQPFRFAGGKVGGLAAFAPIQAQVDAGATLDLTAYTESEQAIDGLAFDGTLGGGTILGGALAAEGRIDLTRYDVFANEPITLDLDGTADVANIEGWPVFVDGAAYSECHPTYDATEKKLSVNSPYAYHHVTETSTGDIQALYPDKSIILEIDENANFTNSAALTGSKSIILTGLGRFVLSQSSPDYSGTITVSRGRLDGRYDNAYGKGTVEIARGATGTCLVILGSTTQNTTYDNDIVIRPDARYASSTEPSVWIVTMNQKTMTLNGNVTAYGDLYIKDDTQGNSQISDLVYFRGNVNADEWGVAYPCDNRVHWLGRLVCKSFTAKSGSPGMGVHYFSSSENRIGTITCLYNSVCAVDADVLGGAAWAFPNGADTEVHRGVLWPVGYSQTLSCLKGVPSNYGFSIDYNSNSASTLTLTGGVATATVSAALGRPEGTKNYGNVSLVVDAGNDDFVQVFTNSVGTTFGTVTVNNGTLRFAGASSLTNAPSLTVTGGRLELETTKENAFAHVTSVTVGADATLRVGASAVTPFVDGKKTVLTLDRTGAVELPEGAAVTVNKAYWSDGVLLPAGVYTGAEGEDGDRTVLPQITGAGTLTVLKGYGMLLIFR